MATLTATSNKNSKTIIMNISNNPMLSEQLKATDREQLLAMHTVVDGKRFNPDDYKLKRANTLADMLIAKIAKNNKLYDLLSDKGFAQFVPTNVAVQAEKTDAPVAAPVAEQATAAPIETAKKKNLKIADMSPTQIIEKLTDKQKDLLETIVKNYDSVEGGVFSHKIMSGKEAWSLGGVATSLIEKGVLELTGKGVSKKFFITEDFKAFYLAKK